jgi:protein-L-isoaspartate(D-aspartate) O-methyltransferase
MNTLNEKEFDSLRISMVEEQIAARGIISERVLDAMRRIPRHLFVPEHLRGQAYSDRPLPIGSGQTISQPYIAAFMTEALDINISDRILEIGTGSGYQAALLAELAAEVYTVEIIDELAEKSSCLIAELNYSTVLTRSGDGHIGWPEAAPFNSIIVTCAPEKIPPVLTEQLADGGRLIIPLGPEHSVQILEILEKRNGKLRCLKSLPVRFVPMTASAS